MLTALGIRHNRRVQNVEVTLHRPPIFWANTNEFIYRHSDLRGERFLHTAVPLLFGILGFSMAMTSMNTVIRYISL